MSTRAIDIAYECLEKRKDGLTFKDLWGYVKTKLGYSELMASKKISQFYTDLSLDGRFAVLDNSVWNLKIHCKYDDVAVSEEEIEGNDENDSEEEYVEDTEMDADEEVVTDY